MAKGKSTRKGAFPTLIEIMKNKTCLLVSAVALLLTGCQTPAVGSDSLASSGSSAASSAADSSMSSSEAAGSSSSGSSESSSSSSEDVDAKKQAILDFVNAAEAGDNYTYAYSDGSFFVNNPTILTSDYISYPSSEMARVALPSYEGEGQELLYDVDKVDGEYSIVAAATYTDELTGEAHGYHSVNELDYLALLKREDVAWGTEAIFEQSGNYMSEDGDVILIFANMFGLANYTDYVMRVLFTLDGERLYIDFIPNYKDTDGTAAPIIEGTKGVIYDVGTSFDQGVANFLASYEMPTESLSENSLNYLKGDKVTYSADLTLYLDGIPDSYPAKATFSYDFAAKRAKIVDSSLGNPDASYYAEASDGTLVEQFLSPENRLVELNQGITYDEWIPDLLDLIDYKAFLKVSDTTYRYYGYQYDKLVKGMTGAEDGMGLVVDMEAKVDESGNLVEVTATSRDVLLTGTGTYHYGMTLRFGPAESIENVDVYKDEGDEKIKTALSALTSENGYSITAYREGYPAYYEKLTVAGNVILRDTTGADLLDGPVRIYDGYYYNEGIAPFRVEDDKAALYGDADPAYTSVDDFLGYQDIAAASLEFDNDGYIVPRAYVKGYKDLLFLGPNGDLMDETTLRFVYDEASARITGYEYDVPGFESERADIVYGASLPTDIDFSALGEGFTAPTSWKDGCPELYEKLKAIEWIGDAVDEIPYLYDPVLNDYWFFGSEGGTTILEALITNNYYLIGNEYASAYTHRYEEYIVEECGFQPGQGTPTRYGKEGLPFVICINSYGDDSMIDIAIRNAEWYPFYPLA